jgi:hypothetical protein
MNNSLINVLQNWMVTEPVASLWLGISSVLLFGTTFRSLTNQTGLSWERGFFGALTRSLGIVSLVGACYFLLNSNFKTFSQLYGSFTTGGSLSNRAWQQWRNLYGGGYDQKDLQVVQYVTVINDVVIPSDHPAAVSLYRHVKVEQPIQQNSIVGFRGNVELTAAGGYNNANTFNGYALSAEYEYDIVNSALQETRAEFRFPISPQSKLYQDIFLTADGVELPWRIKDQAIFWEEQLAPGQQQRINIRFHTWGENDFLFEVPEQREITNFSLKLTMNTDNC